MKIGKRIYSALSASADVQAIVGGRVHPVVIPQRGKMPCVTYINISGIRENDLAGAGEAQHVRVQVDCWACSYAGVHKLAKAVTDALVAVDFLPINERDGFEDAVKVHRVILEFSKWEKNDGE